MTQMPISVLFVRAGLFDGAFSLWVSLRNLAELTETNIKNCENGRGAE